MANLFTVPAGKLNAFTGQLAEAGLTAETILAADKKPIIVLAMVEAAQRIVGAAQRIIKAPDQNPFEQTVMEQIVALFHACSEEGWTLSDEVIDRLIKTAPAWPKGRDSYRSFRIRFGEGDKGVRMTFEAHAARIERVYGSARFCRYNTLLSDKAHLRLLAGNAMHKPVIEWIIVHLDADRKRESIEAVRGPKSLADEGLVIAWLFPKRVEAIDYGEWCAWFCAGYKLHVSHADGSWQSVPCVTRHVSDGRVGLDIGERSDNDRDFSVPGSEE